MQIINKSQNNTDIDLKYSLSTLTISSMHDNRNHEITEFKYPKNNLNLAGIKLF